MIAAVATQVGVVSAGTIVVLIGNAKQIPFCKRVCVCVCGVCERVCVYGGAGGGAYFRGRDRRCTLTFHSDGESRT